MVIIESVKKSILFFMGLVIFILFPFLGYNSPIPFIQATHSVFLMSVIGVVWLLLSVFLLRGNLELKRIRIVDGLLVLIVGFTLLNSFILQDACAVSFRLYDLIGLGFLYATMRIMDLKYVWLFLLVGAFSQVVYGELQLYGVYPSLHPRFLITGNFFNPGPYSGYLAVAFPSALGLYLFIDQWPEISRIWMKNSIKYLSLATIFGILLVFSITASRAGWLALILSGSLLYVYRYRWHQNFREVLNTRLRRALGVVFGVTLLAVVLSGMYLLREDSADGRMLIWRASGKIISENPFIGIGYDRFKAGYMEAQATWFRENPSDLAISLADDVVYAFNEGIQLLVEQGTIGFALILGLLLAVFLIRGSHDRPEVWLAQAGLFSLLIFGMFSYPSHILPIKVFGAFYLSILAPHSKMVASYYPEQYRGVPRWPLSLFVFVLAAGLLWQANKIYRAASVWEKAFSYFQNDSYQASLFLYEEAYLVFFRDGEFLTNYGKALSVAGEHERAVSILEIAKSYLSNTIIQTTLGDSYMALCMYEEAEKSYQLAADMLPDRFYPKYLLTKLYQRIGEEKKMNQLAQYLIKKDPKISSEAVREIKMELKRILEEN